MTELIIIVTAAMLTSAACSLFEAVLYSVPISFVESLAQSGGPSGRVLQGLRRDVGRPIAAILALNTVANATGAALAGAVVTRAFGHHWLAWFSIAFTVAILLFSEILPKTTGVVYNRALAPWVAWPLQIMVWVLAPLVWVCQLAAKVVKHEGHKPRVSSTDLLNMAHMGLKSGTLNLDEANVIKNMLSLESKTAHDVMTHRTSVFALEAKRTVEQALEHGDVDLHSRIPVYEGDLDHLVGIAHRRDILAAVADDRSTVTIGELMHPAHFVRHSAPLDQVLHLFLSLGRQLFVVLDEERGVDGIVSLEDVLEEILGREIEDEFDEVSDKRAYARRRREELMKKLLDSPGGKPHETGPGPA